MTYNKPLFVLALFFGLFGDFYWLGAVFFPKQIIEFTLIFAPDISYGDLNDAGKDVFRVMIGIIGSLLWIVSALLVSVSRNYTIDARNWVALGTIAWVIGDSIISFLGGFEYNVISNLAFGLPVLAVLYFSKIEK